MLISKIGGHIVDTRGRPIERRIDRAWSSGLVIDECAHCWTSDILGVYDGTIAVIQQHRSITPYVMPPRCRSLPVFSCGTPPLLRHD